MRETLNTGKGFVPVIAAPQTPNWRVTDVARYFGVKPKTVYGWVYQNRIPFHKTPGGGLRFVEAEVKAAQSNNKQ